MAPIRFAIFILVASIAFSPAFAQDASKAEAPVAQQSSGAGLVRDLPGDSTSQRTIGEGPERLSYTATAGTLPLRNEKGETAARIFYVAYTTGEPGRPISFVFNGGPGAAAAFLHLGALGPKVLNFTGNGAHPAKPIALSDNPDSWLSFTDLVFVDPVGTGFSRATGSGEEVKKAYYAVDKDAKAMTEFVRLYLTRTARQLAPVFVVGESYGGFRAALLTHRLLQKGLQVKGAILISPALEFSMIRGDDYALVPLALMLPSLAASHLERSEGYDAPLGPVHEAEKFARTDYLSHLVQGLNMDDATVARLARLTGIAPEMIERHHGRIDRSLFRQDFKRSRNRTVSVYDGAISAPLPRPAGRSDFDPILDAAVTALTPLMENYAREVLGFKTDLPYDLLNREVNGVWDFGTRPNRQGYAGSLDELQEARTLNPDLKVFIAHGYTDLATPYSVSEFLIGQLRPIANARPIELHVYRGGHMMYMRPASRRALRDDVSAIYSRGAER